MIEDIEKALSENKQITVTFTKKNGESRVMKCVATPEVIGDSYTYVGEGPAKSDANRTVWDVDKHAWRMFAWDSVTGYAIPE